MKIAVLGINFHPELVGISVYTTEMCQYLSKKGHQVTVFTGFPYYPGWRKDPLHKGKLYRNEQLDGVRIKRSYLYVPGKVRTITRILHELSFMCSSFINLIFSARPDVLIAVSPPLGLGLVAFVISKIKRIPFVFHVQDLQPDAAAELRMLHPGFLLKVLFIMESFIYSKAARISVISRKMGEKIKSKIRDIDKVITFRNWVNIETFQPQSDDIGFRSENDLVNKFVVFYSGNVGFKQGLHIILEAAQKTMEHRDIVYVIAGDGAYKKQLMSDYKKSNLSNVKFLPLQPIENYPSVLAACDVCIIPQRKTAIDIALPSKLLAIMSSAKPVIVSALEGSELHRIVTEAGCGIVVEPGNSKQAAEEVIRACGNPEDMYKKGLNGRAYAIEHFSRDKILAGFELELIRI